MTYLPRRSKSKMSRVGWKDRGKMSMWKRKVPPPPRVKLKPLTS